MWGSCSCISIRTADRPFFSSQRLKIPISRFHWGRFFLLSNMEMPCSGSDWVVFLEFFLVNLGLWEPILSNTPFIPCTGALWELTVLTVTALELWKYPETCLFSLRQQLQHSTNQLAKETNELLKELGSLPLPLSASEQVGIFWYVCSFNRKGLCFNGKTVCETKITWSLVLGRPSLTLSFLICKIGLCDYCDNIKNVCTGSCKVLSIQ